MAIPYTFLRRRIYRRWVGTYGSLLAISEYTRGWVERYWKLPSTILYPPVETAESCSLQSKERKILAIGRFFSGSHNKKHDAMIRAFAALPELHQKGWELHLAGGATPGEGTTAYIAEMRRLARGLPVFFHLDISKERLTDLQIKSSLFWHATGFGENQANDPYLFEHFGLSTAEAMSHGCVPLAFGAGGQREIIVHGDSGFLWQTLEQLRSLTLSLSHNRPLRQAMASSALTRSHDFSRDVFRRSAKALLVEKLLDQTANRARPSYQLPTAIRAAPSSSPR
jgi:glycosyltransferase involved in cell wall biosynthesis